MVVQEIEDVSLCAFVKSHIYLFCSESGPFLLFSKKMLSKLQQENQSSEPLVHGRAAVVHHVSYRQQHLFIQFSSNVHNSQLLQQWNSLEDSSRKKYIRKASPCPEPTLSLFRPDVCFGSVSETFHCIADKYLQDRGQQREDRLDAHRSSLINLQVLWLPGQP